MVRMGRPLLKIESAVPWTARDSAEAATSLSRRRVGNRKFLEPPDVAREGPIWIRWGLNPARQDANRTRCGANRTRQDAIRTRCGAIPTRHGAIRTVSGRNCELS